MNPRLAAAMFALGLLVNIVNANLRAMEREDALARASSPSGVATMRAMVESGAGNGVRMAETDASGRLFELVRLTNSGMPPGAAATKAWGGGGGAVFRFTTPALSPPRAALRATSPTIDHPCARRWWSEIVRAGEKHNVDPELIVHFMGNESACNRGALSHAGAMGLMQLMPTTARDIAPRCGEDASNVWDPKTNVSLGACYLRMMANTLTGGRLETYDDVFRVAWAYNAGPGAVQRGFLPAETRPYASAIAAAVARD